MRETEKKTTKINLLLLALSVALFALGAQAQAQQATRIPHIGYLAPTKYESREKAFRQGLHDLGYIEGQNIFIEWRVGGPNVDRLRELAAELVHLKVDIIALRARSQFKLLKV